MLRHVLLTLSILLGFAASALAEPHQTGLKQPPGWKGLAGWDSTHSHKRLGAAPLPASWDWRKVGAGVTEVRNQRACGSCWAHSVLAVTEAVYSLLKGPQLDTSEQHLVSTCCRAGDCRGGYFNAFDCVKIGVPSEAALPYKAKNSRCISGLTPVAAITRWAYVGAGGKQPTVDETKAALLKHGPLSVDVAAGAGRWSGYRSGVYTSCSYAGTDHMVSLVGWQDDAAYAAYGGGYWIVKNSWGNAWGEQGYIRMVYQDKRGRKCNGLGKVAAYAVMDGVEDLYGKVVGATDKMGEIIQ